jgi:hypothetical protein
VHQVVGGGEREWLAELLFEDASCLRPTQRADATIGIGRSGGDALLEASEFLVVERGRTPGRFARDQRVNAAVAVASGPLIDELPRAADGADDLRACEFRSVIAFEREQDDAIAVALNGRVGLGHASANQVQINRRTWVNRHIGLHARVAAILSHCPKSARPHRSARGNS